MITPMHLSQILPVDVGVDLGRRDVYVAEHLLDRTKVGAALEEMRGEGVSQGVRRDMLRDAHSLHVTAKDLPRAHPRQRASACIEEENPLSFALLELRAELAQVDGNRPDGRPADRDETLLAP